MLPALSEDLYKEIDRLNREVERLTLENAVFRDERDEARRGFEEADRLRKKEEKGHQTEVTILRGQKEKLEETVTRLSGKILNAIGGYNAFIAAFDKYGNHLPGCAGGDACGCGHREAKRNLHRILEAIEK